MEKTSKTCLFSYFSITLNTYDKYTWNSSYVIYVIRSFEVLGGLATADLSGLLCKTYNTQRYDAVD